MLTWSRGGPRYWYPLSYFGSLALQPTALIGLNADLKPPKLSLHCTVRPSVFAYAPPLSAEAMQEVRPRTSHCC